MRKFPRNYLMEFRVFKRLDTPHKVQDFLNMIPVNFERQGETCYSPRMVLRKKKAHCMEGALLAAAILWYHGKKPMLLNLKTARGDDDHTVALFREGGRWGALSKTNHAVLRYRDPVYRTPRELAMSYFHEYFLDDGTKTLRAYSKPFDLSLLPDDWLISPKNLWNVAKKLDRSPHTTIVSTLGARGLRRADSVERAAGKLTEWRKN